MHFGGHKKKGKRKESQEKENGCLSINLSPLVEINEWTKKKTHMPRGLCVENMSYSEQNVTTMFRNASGVLFCFVLVPL